jgi:DNA-binding protein HU-beta
MPQESLYRKISNRVGRCVQTPNIERCGRRFKTLSVEQYTTSVRAEKTRTCVRYLQGVQMTKANLIDYVAEATKATKKETEQVIDAVLASITEALAKGEKVDLRGFGSFQVSGKKERQGRNPRTGETMTIAARNVAVFKPSKELSGRLNGTGCGRRRD